MTLRYDPDISPDPQEWLSTDGEDRIEAVLTWHEEVETRSEPESGWQLHSSLHAQVETRIAEGGAEADKLAELTRAGLSRHDAVHAIASVLQRLMEDVVKKGADATGFEALLRDLTAERYLREHSRDQSRQASRPDKAAQNRKRRARRKAQRKARRRGRR